MTNGEVAVSLSGENSDEGGGGVWFVMVRGDYARIAELAASVWREIAVFFLSLILEIRFVRENSRRVCELFYGNEIVRWWNIFDKFWIYII